jgi:hypothetical protein
MAFFLGLSIVSILECFCYLFVWTVRKCDGDDDEEEERERWKERVRDNNEVRPEQPKEDPRQRAASR